MLCSPSTPKACAPKEVPATGSWRLALPSCMPILCVGGQTWGSSWLSPLQTMLECGEKQLNAQEALHHSGNAEVLVTLEQLEAPEGCKREAETAWMAAGCCSKLSMMKHSRQFYMLY